MDFESTSRYVPSRLSLWCPVCGAKEGQPCKAVKEDLTLRMSSHNNYALGTVPRSVTKSDALPYQQTKIPENRPRWTQSRWVQ